MSEEEIRHPEGSRARHYAWPWFVLAAVVLGVLLAVVWMSREIKHTRQLREMNSGTPDLKK